MSGKSQAPMETNFSHRDNLELLVQESREAELPVLGELKYDTNLMGWLLNEYVRFLLIHLSVNLAGQGS